MHPRTQLHPLPAAAPRPYRQATAGEDPHNLIERIREAEAHRWRGEAEGLKVSLAGARAKLAEMDQITARRATTQLGLPTFTQASGRSSSIQQNHEDENK